MGGVIGGLAGMVGGFAANGAMKITGDPAEPRLVPGLMLGGSLAGLAVAAYLTAEDPGGDGAGEDDEAAASLTAPGALLNWSPRGWALSAPLPSPVGLASTRSAGPAGLAWKVPLLNLRF